MKFCFNCGTKLLDNAAFCSSCGQRLSVAVETADEAPTNSGRRTAARDISFQRIRGTVKGSPRRVAFALFAVLISALMLLFSFLPISRLDNDALPEQIEDLEVKFSVFDNVALFFDLLKNYEYEDIEDTRLGTKLSELNEEMTEAFEDYCEFEDIEDVSDISVSELPSELQDMISKYVKLYMRFSAQTDSASLSYMSAFAAILSITYVALCLLVLILAFLLALNSLGITADRSAERAFVRLISFAPLTLLLLLFTMSSSIGSIKPTAGSIISMILAALMIITLLVFNVIKREFPCLRSFIYRTITSAFAIVIIVAMSLPAVTSSVRTEFSGKSKKSTVEIPLYITYFDSLGLSEDEQEYADEIRALNKNDKTDTLKAAFDSFSSLKIKEAKSLSGENLNEEYLLSLNAARGLHKSFAFFEFSSLAYIIVYAIAAAVLANNIAFLILGTRMRLGSRLFFTVCTALTAFTLATFIVYVSSNNITCDVYKQIGYSLRLSAGPIVALVFSILGIFVPSPIKATLEPRAFMDNSFSEEETEQTFPIQEEFPVAEKESLPEEAEILGLVYKEI